MVQYTSLHRDIRPRNIVLRCDDGSPVLVDVGAARHSLGAKSRSITAVITPGGYAPSEQDVLCTGGP